MNYINNISRAFKHRHYRNYFFFQFLSFTGTWLQSTAQSWLVYRLTDSALFLGVVSFAGTIPSLIFAPLSGVVSDKFKRKKILITTQILCLIQGVIFASLFFTGTINEWHIVMLAIFLGVINAFDVTARQSFIPLLISKEDLVSGIAMNSTMFNAARMIGPAIAGILIAVYSEGICFLLNVFSYIPIILFLFFVNEQEQVIKEFTSGFAYFKEGILFAWKNRPIRALLLLIGTYSFWGMSFSSLMPIFSEEILHAGPKGLGLLVATSGIGAVLGGILLAGRKNILGVKRIIAFCSVLFSVSLFLFAFSKSFFLSSFLLMLVGFCFMIVNAGSNTSLQAMSPDHLRGRIIGLYSTMFLGMFPLGALTIGFIAHNLGSQTAVATGSIVCLVCAVYFSFNVKALTKESKELLET